MFEYMTVQVNNVVRLSRVWLIPKNAKKPADGRYKTNKNQDGVAER